MIGTEAAAVESRPASRAACCTERSGRSVGPVRAARRPSGRPPSSAVPGTSRSEADPRPAGAGRTAHLRWHQASSSATRRRPAATNTHAPRGSHGTNLQVGADAAHIGEVMERVSLFDFALMRVGVLANPPCKGGKAGPEPTKPAGVCRHNSLMFTAWWPRYLSCIHRGDPMCALHQPRHSCHRTSPWRDQHWANSDKHAGHGHQLGNAQVFPQDVHA